MITFFTIPKAFEGHTGVIQRNAIRSWSNIPQSQVIIFGNDDGVAEAAEELGVRHQPLIDCNEFGTPMISDAFNRALVLADTPLIAYVNSDIILTTDFEYAAEALASSKFPMWLMVGQRHDIDITEPLDFEENWEERLKRDVVTRATLHGKSGIDFFLFPVSFPVRLPPMAVGRPGWDSCLIYQTRVSRVPLVDATQVVMTVHQNHPSVYQSNGIEARKNRVAAGGFYSLGTLLDANWVLSKNENNGLMLRRAIIGQLLFISPIRAIRAFKRFLQSFVL